jgi:hypothetical protein
VFGKNAQNIARFLHVKFKKNVHRVKKEEKKSGYFCNFHKIANSISNSPKGENSPNLVTLPVIHERSVEKTFFAPSAEGK